MVVANKGTNYARLQQFQEAKQADKERPGNRSWGEFFGFKSGPNVQALHDREKDQQGWQAYQDSGAYETSGSNKIWQPGAYTTMEDWSRAGKPSSYVPSPAGGYFDGDMVDSEMEAHAGSNARWTSSPTGTPGETTDNSGLEDTAQDTSSKPRPTSGWGGEDLGNGFVSRPSFAAQAFTPDQEGIYDYEEQALRKWYEQNFPDEVAKGDPYTAQMALANIDSPEAWDAILAMAGDIAYDTNPYAREAVIRAVSNTYRDNVPGTDSPDFFDSSTGHYNMDTMGDIYDYDQATRPTLESILRGGKEKWVEGIGKTPTVFGDDMAQTLAYFGLGFPGMSQTEAYELLANDPNAFYAAMPDAVTTNWVELQGASPYTGRSMEDWERARQEFRGDDVVPNDFLDPSVQGFTPSTFSVSDMVQRIKSGSSGASQGSQPSADTGQSNEAPAAAAVTPSAASDPAAQRIQELVANGVTDVAEVSSILKDEGIFPGATDFITYWNMYAH